MSYSPDTQARIVKQQNTKKSYSSPSVSFSTGKNNSYQVAKSEARRRNYTALRSDRAQINDTLARVGYGLLVVLIVITMMIAPHFIEQVIEEKTHYFSPTAVLDTIQLSQVDRMPAVAENVVKLVLAGPFAGWLALIPGNPVSSILDKVVQITIPTAWHLLTADYIRPNSFYEPVLYK